MFENNTQKDKLISPHQVNSAMKDFDNAVKMLIEAIQEGVVMTAIGLAELVKLCFTRYCVTLCFLSGLFAVSRYFIKNAYHLEILRGLAPEIFTLKRISWFYNYTLNEHHFTFYGFLLLLIAFLLGFKLRFIRSKFNRLFHVVGLTNGDGDTPKLVYKRVLDKNRVQYDFDSNGVGIGEFEDKRERLISRFKMDIESIQYGKNQGRVLITFNKKQFPKKVAYREIAEEKMLPKESFYLGESMEGILTQKVAEMPHMLIAGATGSGKSVFFKQCLLGILESSHHLQMYLIDLKGGLEMMDFVEAPNVKVVKKMGEAVILLRQIEREMKARFDYLEKKELKQVVPERDKKERVIIACDEASVLYMNRSKFDPDYKNAMEARQLADSISKLSRAAAIHLLLATQKLDKQVIPTSVSENISGRMAFRANSFQGSMVVLGTKDAYDLPNIPGRAIWSLGNQKVIVQAPYIEDSYIKDCCQRIKNEFKAGRRKLFTPLIGEVQKAEAKSNQKNFDSNLKKTPIVPQKQEN